MNQGGYTQLHEHHDQIHGSEGEMCQKLSFCRVFSGLLYSKHFLNHIFFLTSHIGEQIKTERRQNNMQDESSGHLCC